MKGFFSVLGFLIITWTSFILQTNQDEQKSLLVPAFQTASELIRLWRDRENCLIFLTPTFVKLEVLKFYNLHINSVTHALLFCYLSAPRLPRMVILQYLSHQKGNFCTCAYAKLGMRICAEEETKQPPILVFGTEVKEKKP